MRNSEEPVSNAQPPLKVSATGPLVRAVDLAASGPGVEVLVLDVVGRVNVGSVEGPGRIELLATSAPTWKTTISIEGRDGWDVAVAPERAGEVVVTIWREAGYRRIWPEMAEM